MTVTEGTLPVGDTGENLDTAQVLQTDGTVVHREGVFIGDAENVDARVGVKKASPFLSKENKDKQTYAAGVTDQRLEFVTDTLVDILTELRVMNLHLQQGSDEEIHEGDVG